MHDLVGVRVTGVGVEERGHLLVVSGQDDDQLARPVLVRVRARVRLGVGVRGWGWGWGWG